MGDCVYCGRSAGFLRSKHGECEAINQDGWTEMVEIATESAGTGDLNVAALRTRLAEVGSRAFVEQGRGKIGRDSAVPIREKSRT